MLARIDSERLKTCSEDFIFYDSKKLSSYQAQLLRVFVLKNWTYHGEKFQISRSETKIECMLNYLKSFVPIEFFLNNNKRGSYIEYITVNIIKFSFILL